MGRIYLELTVEYQSMSSKSSTKKRMALAQHLKMSIDVLEEKVRSLPSNRASLLALMSR